MCKTSAFLLAGGKMNKKKVLATLVIIALMLCGCSNNSTETENKDLVEAMEDNQNNKEEPQKDVSYGQFGFGVITEEKGTVSYTYESDNISIPYYVEGLDQSMVSNFGIIVFVDGIAQPYCIKKEDGSFSEEKYMTRFSLKNKERETFDIVFQPISGKKGEKVGVIVATILAPDYLPESKKNLNFGVYHSLSANIPQQISMKKDGINSSINNQKNVIYGDIPREILEDAKNTYGEDIYDILDYSCVLNIVPQEGENVIYEKNGKIYFKIQTYGGLEVTNRITVFINNHPVKLNRDCDYTEVSMKKNKMVEIDCCVDVSQLHDVKEINSLYAIAMTSGCDYEIQDIFKSDSIVVLKQEE